MLRMRSKNQLSLFAAFVLAVTTCSSPQTEETLGATAATKQVVAPPVEVKVTPARRASFPLKIITNGTLTASQQLEVKSEAGGQIIQLPIQVGQAVKKGELLLQLDDKALQLQLEQYHLSLSEAEVNKADLLIANGGQAFVDTSVTPEKLKLVNTFSGYDKALHAIQQAEYELTKTKLYAPFDGIVADLKVKPKQQINAGETICTLLNPATFEAVFTLLEQEAVRIQQGQVVTISPLPLPEQQFSARISSINPVVDEQGLLTVYARLQGSPAAALFEGMHVRVAIERQVPKQLIVPKSALVLRSGRQVIFTYNKEEQLAKWKYVTVAYENDTHIALAEGLEAGEQVIYEGNLNLDHDAAVRVME